MDFFSPEFVIAALSLGLLEVVLGVDNLVFLTIMVGKYPAAIRPKLRRFGLLFAMLTRLGLLGSLSWLANLTHPLMTVGGHSFSGRDLVLLVGGVFLLYKSSQELYEVVEGHGEAEEAAAQADVVKVSTFVLVSAIAQIGFMDIIFSLDSVITAIGMTNNLAAMVGGVVIAMVVMQFGAAAVGTFIERHPSVKVLALGFLVVIAVVLLMEGWGLHVSKETVYAAMGLACIFEALHIRRYSKQAKHQ